MKHPSSINRLSKIRLRFPEKIQWVQPRLVCEVAFAEWTQDGELRQTVFLGWRDDKSPAEVVIETSSISPSSQEIR
jgi:bifunctional non-homologous end joining protein LigD